MSFWIVTDACSDLPASYSKAQQDFSVLGMDYQLDGQPMTIDPMDPQPDVTAHLFYEKLRAGSVATTSQINQHGWTVAVEPLLQQGRDVLMLVFSSGLSGTYLAAAAAAEELSEKYPERKVYAVDTLCPCLSEGLLVDYVLKYRDSGKDIDECLAYANDLIPKIYSWFTVEDLQFLRRGGRLSAVSANFGTLLKIKPILNVSPKGHLIAREKVQGRKKSIRGLFDMVQKYAENPAEQTMFIGHADCLEDARALEARLRDELGVQDIMVSTIGPIIGAHAGPGTVAVFFRGKDAAGRMDEPKEK